VVALVDGKIVTVQGIKNQRFKGSRVQGYSILEFGF
jgi:hypothetical protein